MNAMFPNVHSYRRFELPQDKFVVGETLQLLTEKLNELLPPLIITAFTLRERISIKKIMNAIFVVFIFILSRLVF